MVCLWSLFFPNGVMTPSGVKYFKHKIWFMGNLHHNYQREGKTKPLRDIFKIIMQHYGASWSEVGQHYNMEQFEKHHRQVDDLCKKLGIHPNYDQKLSSEKFTRGDLANSFTSKYVVIMNLLHKKKELTIIKLKQIKREINIIFTNLLT